MTITDFTREHLAMASALTRACYEEERQCTPALPEMVKFPDLTYFADNGLGVAAFEEGEMAGFLCCNSPFDHAFQTTDVKGVFSPMGSNAARRENREKVYARLYEEAAKKWVGAGALSHGICLCAHDYAAQRQFFRYGFGMRCVDAVRLMDPLECEPCEGYTFSEITSGDYSAVYPLDTRKTEHFYKSPCFMKKAPDTYTEFCKEIEASQKRCFAAYCQDTVCAYLTVAKSGETFISEYPGYLHINDAYCLESHRHKGLYQNLLNYVIHVLKKEGYTHLGVDFESINPAASGFWSKYFTPYTHGVVRRIDERILEDVKSDFGTSE